MSAEQKKKIWHRVQNHADSVYLVYDGLSLPIGMTTLAASPADMDLHRTLSATNYLAQGDALDVLNIGLLRHWIQDDHDVTSMGKPKRDISL